MSGRFDIDYSRLLRYSLIGACAVGVLALNYCSLSRHMSSNSQKITDYTIPEEYVERNREPVVAGLFYPADKFLLDKDLESYLSHSAPLDKFPIQPKILIVPHAGYDYSGSVAAKAYLTLTPFAANIKNVILVGPSHQVSFNGAAISGADTFSTPLGKVAINQTLVKELLQHPFIKINDKAHAAEHSLEVQLPFLQKVLPNFQIVPMVYGQISPDDLASALEPLLSSPDTLIVFSADLSHYYDAETASQIDNVTAAQIQSKRSDVAPVQSCGATGINAALELAQTLKLTPEMLDLLNSGSVSGDLSKVVGYGAWRFGPADDEADEDTSISGDLKSLEDFASVHGTSLFKIAQISLEEALMYGKKYSPSRRDYDNTLFNKGASFVAAALEDKRFNPLTAQDLPNLKISISLLTGYERIRYQDEADLLRQIEAGKDGIVLRSGDRQALFLPSVWKELPDKQEFLNNLKLKAGMTPSYWSNKIKVYRFYTVEITDNAN